MTHDHVIVCGSGRSRPERQVQGSQRLPYSYRWIGIQGLLYSTWHLHVFASFNSFIPILRHESSTAPPNQQLAHTSHEPIPACAHTCTPSRAINPGKHGRLSRNPRVSHLDSAGANGREHHVSRPLRSGNQSRSAAVFAAGVAARHAFHRAKRARMPN